MGKYSEVKGKRKILLFCPKQLPQNRPLTPAEAMTPISLLAVGRQFLNEEYQLEIYDSHVDTGYEEMISQVHPELLCIGVTCMAGYQVVDGYNFSKFVKENFPSIPIIWGGWYPTILPEQCLRSKCVDIVVRGQGEVSFMEVVNCLSKGISMDNVKGIFFNSNGEIRKNPPQPFIDPNTFPPINYDLVDISKYSISQGTLRYISSTGCPFKCTFCAVSSVYKHRWYSLPAERVIDELYFLYQKYQLKNVLFSDDNFFQNIKRVKTILRGMIEKKIDIRWQGSARVDTVLHFDKELYDLIRETNCYQIRLGIESGSDRVLDMFKKKLNKEMVEKTFVTLAENRIPIHATYIIAPPTETKGEFWDTIESMKRCLTINKKNGITFYKYTPIPGTELYDKYGEGVLTSKNNLEDCYDLYKNQTANIASPYLYKNDEYDRAAVLFYFHLIFRSPLREGVGSNGIVPLLLKLILSIAKFRWHHKWFALPFEWYLYKWYKLSKLRRSFDVNIQD